MVLWIERLRGILKESEAERDGNGQTKAERAERNENGKTNKQTNNKQTTKQNERKKERSTHPDNALQLSCFERQIERRVIVTDAVGILIRIRHPRRLQTTGDMHEEREEREERKERGREREKRGKAKHLLE